MSGKNTIILMHLSVNTVRNGMMTTRVVKEKKSELQKAADRVREVQEAIEVREEHLKICQREVDQCKLEYDEAVRNREDTFSLLNAQREKLTREINAVRNIVGAHALYSSWEGADKKEVNRSY